MDKKLKGKFDKLTELLKQIDKIKGSIEKSGILMCIEPLNIQTPHSIDKISEILEVKPKEEKPYKDTWAESVIRFNKVKFFEVMHK